MNSTDHKPRQGEIIPATDSGKVVRMSAGALDEQYIHEYLEDPRSKVEALRRAQQSTGIECRVSRQRAYDIHKRLAHKIDTALHDMVTEGATLGFSILIDLAINSDADNVKAACASKLIEYAGKNKPQQNQLPKSRENIKEQIEQTKARILSITGKKI